MEIKEIYNKLEKEFLPFLIKNKNILGINNNEFKNAFINNNINLENWTGKFLCGPSSVSIYYILNNNDIKVYTSRFGYDDYTEDHTFLVLGEYIIDSTYKQFLNPPIFIGKINDLKKIFNSEDIINKWKKRGEITKKVRNFIKVLKN